jgi:methylthioribose-1-phosphate isomerase
MPVKTIEWIDHKIKIIDQTRLPSEVVHLNLGGLEEVAEAIRNLRVRGAPAIGIAAAFGVVVAMQQFVGSRQTFFTELDRAITVLRQTRPTAVNLAWALERVRHVAFAHREQQIDEIQRSLLDEAQRILQEDREICRAIGRHGAELIADSANLITHCNTGALATGDFGTALGALFTAHAQGKKLHVYVDETRPLLQGARLNMWELMQEGIPCTLICDNAAAFVMQRQKIDLCIVGADRIARNGDTANKIGTYSLAVSAQKHGIPFYVAAPISTFDFKIASGLEIPIEERPPEEVSNSFGYRAAPLHAAVYNPAFDVTPHQFISGIVCEKGVMRPPFEPSIHALALSIMEK